MKTRSGTGRHRGRLYRSLLCGLLLIPSPLLVADTGLITTRLTANTPGTQAPALIPSAQLVVNLERWTKYQNAKFDGSFFLEVAKAEGELVTFRRMDEEGVESFLGFVLDLPPGVAVSIDKYSALDVRIMCGDEALARNFRSKDIIAPHRFQAGEERSLLSPFTMEAIDPRREGAENWETVAYGSEGKQCYVLYAQFDFGSCVPKRVVEWDVVSFTLYRPEGSR